jgi:hypothetical protein
MSQRIKTDRMPIKNVLLYIGPVSILFILMGVSSFFFDGTYFKPGILAWMLASINFVAALGSLKVAQKKALVPSMLLVFGGGALRILVMISAIIIIMIKKEIWMVPFCIVLLTCFIIYLVIEVTVLYRQGITQERPLEKLG